MATFEARVEGKTGLDIGSSGTTPTQAELSEFLKDSVLEITNIYIALKPEDASLFVITSAESDSQGGITINSGKVVSVVREANSNNDWRDARPISPGQQARVTDKNSLEYASVFNPAYLITEDGTISVFPAPSAGGSNSYKVYHINGTVKDKTNDATLTYAHIDIASFPEDLTHLVVLRASIKCIEAKLSEQAIDEEDQELVAALTPLLTSFKEDWQMSISIIAPSGKEQQ
jgi:hypothetical protein